MKIDRVRPMVAFVLVALASAFVLVAGLQSNAIEKVVRRADPSAFGTLGSSALLGSVLDLRPVPPGTATVHPVSVSFVRSVAPQRSTHTTAAHHGSSAVKGTKGRNATSGHHPASGKGHHATAAAVPTNRVDVTVVDTAVKQHGRRSKVLTVQPTTVHGHKKS